MQIQEQKSESLSARAEAQTKLAEAVHEMVNCDTHRVEVVNWLPSEDCFNTCIQAYIEYSVFIAACRSLQELPREYQLLWQNDFIAAIYFQAPHDA